MKPHFQQLADYNLWANGLLYDTVSDLDDEAIHQDIGAFFGSIMGTLNHILVGDLAWLSRIDNNGPAPSSLDEVLHTNISDLAKARLEMDLRIKAAVDQLSEEDIHGTLSYHNIAGEAQQTKMSDVLTHVFNHQTHHRGQCHQSLTQIGVDAPSMDLIYYLRSLN
jgi:uncharacterized damage-inducible protein DinB